MIRAIVRFLLAGAAFAYVLPLIPGIDFHGNFGAAIGAALVFSIVGWLVDLLAKVLSALWAIGTMGLALLVLIPLWILGFWLLPAVTLKLVADMMPAHLTVSGWIPAIEGGLVMMIIGALTAFGGRSKKEE